MKISWKVPGTMANSIHVRPSALLFMALLASVSIAAIAASPTQADALKASNGAKCYELSAGKVYSQYDVTGDRKADTISIDLNGYASDLYSSISVYINEKPALQANARFYKLAAQLVTLRNGKSFIHLKTYGDNDYSDICGVYKVSQGKLKRVIDCNKGFGRKAGTHTGGDIIKVSGDSMKMRFTVMAYMTGRSYAEYTYKYASGTLKKTSKIGKLCVGSRKSNTYKAKKSIQAYTGSKCKVKKFKIRARQKVRFLAVRVDGDTVRYRVKVAHNKIGWIKVANSYRSPLLYKNWTEDDYYICEPPFEGLGLAG